jgi:uncharacterized protein (TIGR01244 family)
MNITQITQDYSVSPQIGAADVADIAAHGFRAIMCNRPDGESPDQTDVASIRAEAEARGLAFSFVPVVSGAITGENLAEYKAAIDALPKPILAYCRSGARCQNLWIMTR